MGTHNQYYEPKYEKYKNNHLKINIFTAVKYCCILHGRVCVMETQLEETGFNFTLTCLCNILWFIVVAKMTFFRCGYMQEFPK